MTTATSPRVEFTGWSLDEFRREARNAILTPVLGMRPNMVWDRSAGKYEFWNPSRTYALGKVEDFVQAGLRAVGTAESDVNKIGRVQAAQILLGSPLHSFGITSGLGVSGAYNVSGMFQDILLDASNAALRDGYDDSRTTYQNWMKEARPFADFRPRHQVITGELGDPRAIPEDGEFEEMTFTDARETYKLTTWGETVSLSWQATVNDGLHAFAQNAQKLGRAIKRKQNRLAYGALKDNLALSDGVALFATTHRNDSTGVLSTSEDFGQAWNLMSGNMGTQTGIGDAANILDIRPKFVLFPPALRGTILQTLRSSSVATSTAGNSGTGNIWQKQLEPIEDGELSASAGGSDTAHYLVAGHEEIDTAEFAFLKGQETPVIEQAVMFDRLGMRQRIYQSFGVKVIDHRGMQRHTGE